MIVVHVKDKCDVYGGRSNNYGDMSNTAAPNRGWLGNPYRIGPDGTREEVIAKFEKDFKEKIEKDMHFRKHVLALKCKRVGCFCSPLPCHLDIVARWLNE